MTDRPNSFPPNSPATTPAPPARSSHAGLIIVVLVFIAVVGVVFWAIQHQKVAAAKAASARNFQPPAPVVVGKVAVKDVPIYLDGLGTVAAYNTVTVRARVDGQLVAVKFTEGQDVHTNDVLALIDPAPFRAALDQAIAKKAQDEAQLANAQLDLTRETNLFAHGIDSQQMYATQQALVNQLTAAVNADQAAIESAQVQLNYTTIVSPLDGRTGIRNVDAGNIVHAADTNGLVIITQLKPISVVFTLPEQDLSQIRQQFSLGRDPSDFKVFAVARDNSTVISEGQLAVIDNQIDVSTATIRLKATFPNTDLKLWPGQFVNVRLLLTTRKNGLVVPSPVVQRGPEGEYAFLVEGEGTNLTVKQQTISVAQTEGTNALIDSGLQAGQTVVVDGQYKLQNGSKVSVARSGGNGRPTNSAPLEATNP